MVMATSTASAATAAAVPTSPLADTSSIGTITLQGLAVGHSDVANLLFQLAKEKGLSDKPVVASSVEDTSLLGIGHPLVKFSVNQTVDSNARPGSPAPSATTPTATTPTTKPAGN
jgi:hypothetical protein